MIDNVDDLHKYVAAFVGEYNRLLAQLNQARAAALVVTVPDASCWACVLVERRGTRESKQISEVQRREDVDREVTGWTSHFRQSGEFLNSFVIARKSDLNGRDAATFARDVWRAEPPSPEQRTRIRAYLQRLQNDNGIIDTVDLLSLRVNKQPLTEAEAEDTLSHMELRGLATKNTRIRSGYAVYSITPEGVDWLATIDDQTPVITGNMDLERVRNAILVCLYRLRTGKLGTPTATVGSPQLLQEVAPWFPGFTKGELEEFMPATETYLRGKGYVHITDSLAGGKFFVCQITADGMDQAERLMGLQKSRRDPRSLDKAPQDPPKKAGKTYGRWVSVGDSPGEGGQGFIYLVHDQNDASKRLYVLKRLKNRDRLDRFRREIEAIGRLDHPNIIRLRDSDLEAAKPYLVTDYCEGGSLERAFKKRAFANHDVISLMELFESICEGVNEAHRQGIIHRDLKPANILLELDGVPRVADFGLCYFESGERFTLLEEAVGSRYFIAPELEDGIVKEPDKRSDIYSLGKLMHWMVNGGRTFAREGKHRRREWDVSHVYEDARLEHLNRLFDATITTDPAARPADASELLALTRKVKRLLKGRYNAVGPDIIQPCLYCGEGEYQRVSGQDLHGYVISPGAPGWRVLTCNACGHVQTFRVDRARRKEWWPDENGQLKIKVKPSQWVGDHGPGAVVALDAAVASRAVSDGLAEWSI